MKYIILILLFINLSAEEVPVFDKSMTAALQMIANGKNDDAMNEIRVAINCYWVERHANFNGETDFNNAVNSENDAKKRALYRIGLAAYKLVRINSAQEAITILNLAENDDNTLPEVYNTRGVCYSILKDDSKALVDYSRAIELRPTYIDALSNRCNLYTRQGYISQAVKDKEVYSRLIQTMNYRK